MTPPDAPRPSEWVKRFLPGIVSGGEGLDVACGRGRHLRLMSSLGLPVTGIDRDISGVRDLEGAPGVTLLEADLEAGGAFPLVGRTFAAVVVTNYLWRPLLPDLVAATAEDGLFLYETFALGQERFGRPANPDFLLRANELIDAVRPRLTVLAYEHGALGGGARRNVIQRIAACGPRHPWAVSGMI